MALFVCYKDLTHSNAYVQSMDTDDNLDTVERQLVAHAFHGLDPDLENYASEVIQFACVNSQRFRPTHIFIVHRNTNILL